MSGRVLVTGAAGLIGNALRVALEASGREVLAADTVPATEEGRALTVADVTDTHRLHALAAAQPLEAIIHCGAFSGPMVARDNPHAIVRVNLVGTANLLELARLHGIRRVVFCSSVSAYGSTPPGLEPVPEDVPLHPTTVYGASKAAGEALIDGYASQHGVDAVALRISWVYGPRRRTDCAIREMLRAAQTGRTFVLPSGRAHARQFIHVDDAVTALIAALEVGAPRRRAYNVTGGERRTLGEVATMVRALYPGAAIDVADSSDPAEDVQARFDLSAAAHDLGWEPRIRLADGLQSYAAWLAAHPPSAGSA